MRLEGTDQNLLFYMDEMEFEKNVRTTMRAR